jgi:PDZ domain/Aspartyl protease
MYKRWIGLGLVLASLTPTLRGDDAKPPPPTRTIRVPYRLTDTQHVLVRVKINGKGPFHFIIDTGAPLLYVSTAVGKKLDLAPDKKGWATLDRFEVEGGVVQNKVKCRVETPFQLEGMNSMGLAGVELHGIIGYTVLAQYRLEFDFTRDTMGWTRLDFTPPPPLPFSGKAGATAGIESMAGLMKLAAFLMGTKPAPEVAPRGFFGMQVAEVEKAVSVTSVLPKSPAAVQGIKAGDRIVQVNGKEVSTVADVNRLMSKVRVGDTVRFTIIRGLERMTIAIRAREGL